MNLLGIGFIVLLLCVIVSTFTTQPFHCLVRADEEVLVLLSSTQVEHGPRSIW